MSDSLFVRGETPGDGGDGGNGGGAGGGTGGDEEGTESA
jgi:hypothetical protein